MAPFPGLLAIAAGLALIVGSFLPWEQSFASNVGASSHSGLDCYCGGGLTVALGTILMVWAARSSATVHPSLPRFARVITWVPDDRRSLVAAWLVTILWADVRDDESTVAVGFGVFVMAAGTALGVIASILMRVLCPRQKPERRDGLSPSWTGRGIVEA